MGHEIVEHMEHAAHGGGHGHGGGHEPHHARFSTSVGITMAVLGVLLAYSSAKVGGERTELVKAMVEQEHAHVQYVTQDMKHRVAVIALRQVHSTFDPKAPAALDAEIQKIADAAQADIAKSPAIGAALNAIRQAGRGILEHVMPNHDDVLAIIRTVERYDGEAKLATAWVTTFQPAINAHVEAQEEYEKAQLAAEIGIVIASVALMLKRRLAWFVSLALGVTSIVIIAMTYQHTSKVVGDAETKIEESGKDYNDLRVADKKKATDNKLVADTLEQLGETASEPPTTEHSEQKPAERSSEEKPAEPAAEHH